MNTGWQHATGQTTEVRLSFVSRTSLQEDSHRSEVRLSEKPDFEIRHTYGGLTAITATTTRLAPARFNMRAAS